MAEEKIEVKEKKYRPYLVEDKNKNLCMIEKPEEEVKETIEKLVLKRETRKCRWQEKEMDRGNSYER